MPTNVNVLFFYFLLLVVQVEWFVIVLFQNNPQNNNALVYFPFSLFVLALIQLYISVKNKRK